MANVGSPFMNSCILTAIGVLAIIINSCVISGIGRRRVFLMTGLTICGITQLTIAAVSHVNPSTVGTGKVIVGLPIEYICGYNGMIAAYAWLSGGEIPSQRLRSYAFGVAAAVRFAGAWFATFTAPYFINPDALGWIPEYGQLYPTIPCRNMLIHFIGWSWGPSCFITVVWVYIYLPEIKNRTLEEIDEMFEAKLPARKFRKYVCNGRLVPNVDEKTVGRHSSGGVRKTVSRDRKLWVYQRLADL